MKVFVYEFVTGGGLLGIAEAVNSALEPEGRAMVCALAEDLAAGGAHPVVLQDARIDPLEIAGVERRVVATPDEERHEFERAVSEADATLVIAPEIDGHLARRCQMVERAGGTLIGPERELRELAGDKHAMCEHLRAVGVPVPEGREIGRGEPPRDIERPAVIKPRAGAGAHCVYLLPDEDANATGDATCRTRESTMLDVSGRVERFVSGEPASVTLLCGPEVVVPLPACRQQISISDDLRFRYHGGSLICDAALRRRAERLALRVMEALPPARGPVGVDLVLGHDAGGDDDVVIEVNARATTSYVGLRAACRQNLAHALLQVAFGRTVNLEFDLRPLEFDACGGVRQPVSRTA